MLEEWHINSRLFVILMSIPERASGCILLDLSPNTELLQDTSSTNAGKETGDADKEKRVGWVKHLRGAKRCKFGLIGSNKSSSIFLKP